MTPINPSSGAPGSNSQHIVPAPPTSRDSPSGQVFEAEEANVAEILSQLSQRRDVTDGGQPPTNVDISKGDTDSDEDTPPPVVEDGEASSSHSGSDDSDLPQIRLIPVVVRLDQLPPLPLPPPTSRSGESPARLFSLFNSTIEDHIIHRVVDLRQSAFITGPAGSGKTTLLRKLVDLFVSGSKVKDSQIYVIAPTASAALACRGLTIHAFSGIRPGVAHQSDALSIVRSNRLARYRWKHAKVLFIDQVSQIEQRLWDFLDSVAREFRSNSQPFGGLQVVCFGDFLQLPPVSDRANPAFAFESKSWGPMLSPSLSLGSKSFHSPPEFAQALREIREGSVSDETVRYIQSLSRKLSTPLEEAMQLYPTNDDVRDANASELLRLPGPDQSYGAYDTSMNYSKTDRDAWLDSCSAPALLSLRIGARVSLLKTGGKLLPSSSVGTVIGAATYAIWTQLRNECTNEQVSPTLVLVGHGHQRRFGGRPSSWPVVHFRTPTKHIYALIALHEWRFDHGTARQMFVSRTQVPLALSWATTIHRSQGVIYPAVRVDLTKVFLVGQTYVALSRVLHADNLCVIGFSRDKVTTDALPLNFYNLHQTDMELEC
ncbi:hypothetical protein CF319_g5951 [Tilletia indica]|nr:hypothetical protein CF319_g5951 [Tilletia indica]